MTVTQAQLQSLSGGVSTALTNLQSRIEARVLAEALPLVGTGLQTAAQAGEAALRATRTLGEALSDAFDTLAGAATQTEAAVQAALDSALQAAGFSVGAIGVTVQGGVVTVTLATEKLGSYVQALANDLAMTGLGLVGSGTSTVETAFNYALSFGTGAGGFFFDTTGAQEITIDLNVGDLALGPTLGIDGISFEASDAGSSFGGTIGIDVRSAGGQLTAGQLANANLVSVLDGVSALSVEIAPVDKGPMTPPIAATFGVDWAFDGAGIDPAGTNAGFGARPEVTFDTVTLDLGGFMEDFIGPLVEQINDLLEPIRPVIEILNGSIRLLENFPGLGLALDMNGDGRITLLDLVQRVIPGLNLGPLNTLIEVIEDVTDWAAFLASTGFAQGDLVLGSFDLGTADFRAPGFDLSQAVAEFGGLADTLDSIVAGLTGTGWNTLDAGSQRTGKQILQDLIGSSVFDLPILTDPDQWMKMLLGAPADLVTVDLPEIVLGTDTEAGPNQALDSVNIFSFPVFLGVFVRLAGGLQFKMDLDFGFDSRGFIDPALNALDGLYIVDHADKSEILLRSSVGLKVALDAFVAEVWGGGDIEGRVDLDLAPPPGSPEGKFYFDDFIAALTTNPFSIFDASGEITAGFSAGVDTIFGEVWSWSSPRVNIGRFSFDADQDPIDYNLADAAAGVVTLNVGSRAGSRNLATGAVDGPEWVEIGPSVTEGAIRIDLRGYTEEYTGVTRIVGDFGAGRDSFAIDPEYLIAVDLSGGADDDILQGAALNDTLDGNQANDALLGAAGDDTLRGGLGDDFLHGGTGGDLLDGGGGNDRVSYFGSAEGIVLDFDSGSFSGGDAEGDTLIGIEGVEGTAHNDSITGSQGAGAITGMAGDDTIRSGADVQAIYGNDGNDVLEDNGSDDTLVGGEGDDIYIVHSSDTFYSENLMDEIAEGSDSGYDWLQSYVDVDLFGQDEHIERITLFASAFNVRANRQDNLITGNGWDNALQGQEGNDTIYGGAGNDTLDGGSENDRLFAGLNDDLVLGGTGADVLQAGFGADLLFGGHGADSLYGDFGNDTLYGDDGADLMDGGAQDDYFFTDSQDTVMEAAGGGTDYVFVTGDFVLGAGQEVEILSLYDLDGNAWLEACNSVAPVAALGALTLLLGRVGPDTGADIIGNEFNQFLIAHTNVGDGLPVPSASYLEGMDGADTLMGDHGQDTVGYLQSDEAVLINLSAPIQFGGHAQGDVIVNISHVTGSTHDDILIGENSLNGGIEYDNILDGDLGNDTITGLGGDDTLRGGGDDDVLFGGMGDDSINGGGGEDQLFGGESYDTLNGGNGADTLDGGNADDLYYVTTGDILVDEGGDDTAIVTEDFVLTPGVAIEILTAQVQPGSGPDADIAIFGNALAQTIIGNRGDNYLHGGGAADILQGGAGMDTAAYLLSNAGVSVNLNAGPGVGGHAEGDLLGNIEQLQGSTFDDVLIGLSAPASLATADNIHRGEGGDDRIEDAVGENTLYGGAGDDTLIGSGLLGTTYARGGLLSGGAGNDSLDGGAVTAFGGDTLAGGMGDDTYRVTSAGDVIDENRLGDIATGADGGHDTVISDVTVWSMDTAGQATVEDGALGSGRDMTGNALANRITGNGLNNLLSGLAGADTLAGALGDDTLIGGGGADQMNGGAGADRMEGGQGDDTYLVDDAGDTVVETLTGGTDTVRATISHSLAIGVEHLTLLGTAAIDGTGNTLANHILGNTAANRLTGLLGIDTLEGGAGNDTYATDGRDVIIEAADGGTDRVESSGSYALADGLELLVLTGTAAIDGRGNALANIITGNSGANRIEGGLGADTLIGGLGDDTYRQDGGDTIVESVNAGRDLVIASVSTVLGANLEDLRLAGAGRINGTGNALDNRINGNAKANQLDGGSGRDTLAGGRGADSYVTDGDDRIVEAARGGIDRVQSTASHRLAANVEKLQLLGVGDFQGRGNGLNNSLTGNTGDNRLFGLNGRDVLKGGQGQDILNGGKGADRLTGGLGADAFVFDRAAGPADRITDFAVGVDSLRLNDTGFAGLSGGGLGPLAFEANLTGRATAATTRIIYETDTGKLFHDADGSGGGARVHFATLQAGLGLSVADFILF